MVGQLPSPTPDDGKGSTVTTNLPMVEEIPALDVRVEQREFFGAGDVD